MNKENFDIYLDKLEKFKKYMKTQSPETKRFDEIKSISTANSNALRTSQQLRQSSERIDKIDPSAIPNDQKLDKITAKSCGMTLSKQKTIQKNKRRYHTSLKSQIRNIMATGLISSALLLSGKISQNINTYTNLSASENQKNGYETLISIDTQNKLKNIHETIISAKNSGVEPSKDILEAIRFSLDSVIDDVMSDLVIKAFNEKYPDYQVKFVETSYDRSNKVDGPINTCEINYIDENGENIKKITNFNIEIDQSFNYEYDLDYSKLSLKDLEKIYEGVNHLAGTKFIFKDNNFIFAPYLKTTTPDKQKDDLEL